MTAVAADEMTPPAWTVHLGTAGETCVRLYLARWRSGDPWPLSRALIELAGLGAQRSDGPRTLGSGRGAPLLASQSLAWSGCEVYIEAMHPRDGGPPEAALALPSWDELVRQVSGEDAVWELIDAFAAAVDGTCGAIVDGEALGPAPPCRASDWRAWVRRHVAVLARSSEAPSLLDLACAYRALPQSGLTVLLR